MNTEALFLFLILLLGLVIASFLGVSGEGKGGKSFSFNEGFKNKREKKYDSDEDTDEDISEETNEYNTHKKKYDNYNHYNQMSSKLTEGTTFTNSDGNGGTVVVKTNSDGSQNLQITLSKNEPPLTFTSQKPTESVESYTNYYGSITKFYGPNGATATIVKDKYGNQAIRVKTMNGTYLYIHQEYYNNISSTQYYGSTGYHTQPPYNSYTNSVYSSSYNGPNVDAGSITGPNGNTAYYAEGPNGNVVTGTEGTTNNGYYQQNYNTNPNSYSNSYKNQYYDSLPPGIPASQIIPGQEDLYILKSQVVPPVCPVCPAYNNSNDGNNKEVPPCPACARCPEPSFECKKVPNYNAINNDSLPTPVLSDFSSFGM